MGSKSYSLLELVKSWNNTVLHETARNLSGIDPGDLTQALHEAARAGNAPAVKILLNAGGDPFSLNPHGETLLLEGVSSGNVEVITSLLDSGYQINWRLGDASETGTAVPLHVSIERQDEDMAELLMTAGMEIEHRDIDGDTVLIAACNAGLEKVICKVIALRCDIDAHGYEGCTALHRCVEHNNVVVTQMLLSAGAQPDSVDDEGETPLMKCARYECTESAQLLISHGADVEGRNSSGQTPMHLASISDSPEIIELLIGNAADIDVIDRDGNTPLILAACMRNNGALAEFLKQGADCNMQGMGGRSCLHWLCAQGMIEVLQFVAEYLEVDVNVQDHSGETPSIVAAQNKQLDCVTLLLMNADTDVNITGNGGKTLLHWLSITGCNREIFELMLQQGVTIDVIDDDGNSALVLAAANRHYSLARALLKEYCALNVQGQDGKSALHWVCDQGCADLAQSLIQLKCDLDLVDNEGNSALILATENKHTQLVDILISQGANVTIVNNQGRSALHFAAFENMLDSINSMIANGSDTNIQDCNQDTPLTLAASRFHIEIIKTLVSHGADVKINGKDGKSALYYASLKGLAHVVEVLLTAGADPDSDKYTVSPLMQASKNGHAEVVGLLLQARAKVNRRDDTGRTALLWASVGGHAEVSKLLIENGADPLAVDDSHDTALTLAAWHRHLKPLQVLIPLSELDHCERDEGMAALHLAVSKDFKEGVRALLEAGARIDVTDSKGNTAFILAAMHTTDSEILHIILESGQQFDINQKSDKGRSALHWSVGDSDAVRTILPHTDKLSELDANGASPLLLAIAHGQPESAKVLIEAGCDIRLLHQDGRCAIHHACIYGLPEIVQILLEKGINPNMETKDGKSPLLLASIEGHSEIIKILVQYDAELNRVYFDAITALSAATAAKHYQCMKVLLDAGADPHAIGPKKHTALINCIMENNIRGTIILLQANVNIEQPSHDDVRPLKVAIVQKNETVLCLLGSIECDINYIHSLFQQGAIYYFIGNDDVLAGLKALSLSPRSLQKLCRRAVRKIITFPFMSKVKTLPVPQMIKDYLQMKELWKLVEE